MAKLGISRWYIWIWAILMGVLALVAIAMLYFSLFHEPDLDRTADAVEQGDTDGTGTNQTTLAPQTDEVTGAVGGMPEKTEPETETAEAPDTTEPAPEIRSDQPRTTDDETPGTEPSDAPDAAVDVAETPQSVEIDGQKQPAASATEGGATDGAETPDEAETALAQTTPDAQDPDALSADTDATAEVVTEDSAEQAEAATTVGETAETPDPQDATETPGVERIARAPEAPDVEAPAGDDATAGQVPKVEPGTQPDTTPSTEAKPDASAPAPDAPRFDVVRVEPDGTAVIAGRGTPGSELILLVDNQPTDRIKVGPDGNFVSFQQFEVSDAPRVLTMMAEIDGRSVLAPDEIILAPVTVLPVGPQNQITANETATDETTETEQTATARTAAAEPDADATATPVPVDAASVADPAAPQAPGAGDLTAAPGTGPEAEPAQIAVLRSNALGVELLQPAAPETPEDLSRIALDTIGYSAEGDVQLGGRAQTESRIRVYLDNKPVTDLTAGVDGRWSGRLDGIEPGIYTLRLDELDETGSVVSRIETPFKREAPEVLQPPEPATVASADTNAPAAPPIRAVTVQTGDTLWAISRERYGDGVLYVRVFEANKNNIRDPDLIYPGQVFELPD